eukprot:COSAG02_NODE_2291_length_9203_cov_4.256920_5_plen_78_part_00
MIFASACSALCSEGTESMMARTAEIMGEAPSHPREITRPSFEMTRVSSATPECQLFRSRAFKFARGVFKYVLIQSRR